MRHPRTPEETYAPALDAARRELPALVPVHAALRAAVTYQATAPGQGHFVVPFLGTMYHVGWPTGCVQHASDGPPADVTTHLLLLHYLLTADGAPMTGRWIAFRSLPGGLGYDAAFQARANQRLAHAFGTQVEPFSGASRILGGERLEFGDASFCFRVLPQVWLAVVLHRADDEFPADASVLFDGSASHYLPTEDLAVLGGLLAGRLIRAARTP